MDNIASLLGLALKAGRLAVGDEPVGAASRSHKAYLLFLASDAADNTIRRARHYAQAGSNTICLPLPMTREELGGCLGRGSCAMLAVTDVGFAAALAERLARTDPETYGSAREVLSRKALRARQRKKAAERDPMNRKTKRGSSPGKETKPGKTGRGSRS